MFQTGVLAVHSNPAWVPEIFAVGEGPCDDPKLVLTGHYRPSEPPLSRYDYASSNIRARRFSLCGI